MSDNKNMTILFVAHRLSSLKNCTRIIKLDKGRIIEDDNSEYLISYNQ